MKPKYWEGYSLAEDEERAEELFLGRVIKINETGRSSENILYEIAAVNARRLRLWFA